MRNVFLIFLVFVEIIQPIFIWYLFASDVINVLQLTILIVMVLNGVMLFAELLSDVYSIFNKNKKSFRIFYFASLLLLLIQIINTIK